jgi:hypothetical protein
MEGGVAPTVCVPMTIEMAQALFEDKEDVLLSLATSYLNNEQ